MIQHNKPGKMSRPMGSKAILHAVPVPVPATTPVNAATDEGQRQRLRQLHGVRKMEVLENKLMFSEAPRGIFGFAQAGFIYDPSNLELNRDFRESLHFEIHVMSDGTGQLIGFVSSDAAVSLQSEDRPPRYRVTVYNRMWPGASTIVPIRFSRIQPDYSSRSIEIGDATRAKALDVTLRWPESSYVQRSSYSRS